MLTRIIIVCCVFMTAFGAAAEHFRVGYAKSDITPEAPTPMGGYGARGDALSTGVRDPLYARAIVVDAGESKAAFVGIDNRRAPTPAMMETIKAAVLEQAGIDFVMLVATHTHHGPIIELRDAEGMGGGNERFAGAIAYGRAFPGMLIDVIVEAADNVQDARIGWGSKQVDMNRNRHSDIEPKPVDQELSVVRFDDLDGNIITLLVSYAAHPTVLPVDLHEFSAEWPGVMMDSIEERLGVDSAFFQGPCGDLSVKRGPDMEGIEDYGRALADHVIEITEGIETSVPESPSVQGFYDEFTTPTRVDFENPLVVATFQQALFPELANSILPELEGNEITTRLTTVMLNGEVAMAGVSGEVFAALSTRLKERSRAAKTLVFSFCNDHKMYHPTIEGAAEGGYGAGPQVAWVELGTGERMMDHALIRIYDMMGKWDQTEIPQPAGALGSLESEAGR